MHRHKRIPPTPYLIALQRRLRRPIDPRVRHVMLDSKALGVRKRFYLSLPPGYGSPGKAHERYPVLYLFRGHEHEWIHRWQDKSRRGRTAVDVYRLLLEMGIVGQVILVFPGISSDDNRIPGLLVNFKQPELVSESPGIGTGRFEDYFLQDVVAYMDNHYRTIAERGGRAVDGFSLGGFQSIKIAAQHPDMFCSAGSFDGTFLYATRKGRSVKASDRVLGNPIFAPAFGIERDLQYAAQNSPANLLWTQEREALSLIQWLISSGPEEAEPWHANYYRAQHVLSILRERGLENGLPDFYPRAKHSWYWADRHLARTLPLHWQALSDPG